MTRVGRELVEPLSADSPSERLDDRQPAMQGTLDHVKILVPDGFQDALVLATYLGGGRAHPYGIDPGVAQLVEASEGTGERMLEHREGLDALLFGVGLHPVVVEDHVFDGRAVQMAELESTSVVLNGAAASLKGPVQARLSGYFGGPDPVEPGLPWQYSVDGRGPVLQVPTVPGWVTIQVTAGPDAAAWSGLLPVAGNQIELDVVGSVYASGRVDGLPDGLTGVQVSARPQGAHPGSVLTTCSVLEDGSWRMPDVPWVEGGEYTFRLEHESTTPTEADQVAERPGAQLSPTLLWEAGTPLVVIVKDASGNAVSRAKIALQWARGSRWNRSEAGTDEGGVAHFPSAPTGQVYLRAYKPGFASDAHGPTQLPLRGNLPIQLVLESVGSIELRTPEHVSGDALSVQYKPVEGFLQEKLFDIVDSGTYRLLEVRSGPTDLFVLTTGQCSPVGLRVDVPSGGVVHVDVDLVNLASVRGRVVDYATGDGIAGALVETWFKGAGYNANGLLRHQQVSDGGGMFEGLLAHPAGAHVYVTAKGRSSLTDFVEGPLAQDQEVGLFALKPLQAFSLQVAGPLPDLSGYRLEAPKIKGTEGFAFDKNGFVEVLDCPPRRPARFEIRTPAPSIYELFPTLVSGQSWDHELVVDSGRLVTVDLEPLQDVHGPGWYHLRSEYFDRKGMKVVHTHSAAEGATSIVVQDLPMVVCLLSVAKGKEWVATGVFDLTSPGDHNLVVSPASNRVGFRLTSEANESFAGTYGEVTMTEGGRFGWDFYAKEDGLVEVQLAPTGPGRLYATRFAPLAFFQSSVQVSSLEEELEAVEFELPCEASVLLTPTTGEPRTLTVELGFADWWAVRRPLSSDGAGRLDLLRASPEVYRVQVAHPGLWSERFDFDLKPGRTELQFDVRPTGGLRVEIKGPGSDLSGIDVVVWSLADDLRASDWEDRVPSTGRHNTDRNGHLLLPVLPSGPFEVWVAGNRDQASTRVDVLPSEVVSVLVD